MKKWIAAAAIAIPSVTLATLQQQPDTSSGLTLPPGWEKMEIEAKWDIDKAQYDALVKGHPDNGAKLGYDLNVRWGGISRQFIDFYYDSPAHTLAKSLHSIRHRTRSTSCVGSA